MNRYIGLIKITEDGNEHLKEAADVLVKANGIIEAVGGKMVDIWAVMGEYDFVAVVEYPSDVAAFEAVTKMAELGFFDTETLPAIAMDKFLALV